MAPGWLVLHLGSPGAVVVLGPHAELAVVPAAINEDFDVEALAGLRDVERRHWASVKEPADWSTAGRALAL